MLWGQYCPWRAWNWKIVVNRYREANNDGSQIRNKEHEVLPALLLESNNFSRRRRNWLSILLWDFLRKNRAWHDSTRWALFHTYKRCNWFQVMLAYLRLSKRISALLNEGQNTHISLQNIWVGSGQTMVVFSCSENPSSPVVTEIWYHTSAISNAFSVNTRAANGELAYVRAGGNRFGEEEKEKKGGMLCPQTVLLILAF